MSYFVRKNCEDVMNFQRLYSTKEFRVEKTKQKIKGNFDRKVKIEKAGRQERAILEHKEKRSLDEDPKSLL